MAGSGTTMHRFAVGGKAEPFLSSLMRFHLRHSQVAPLLRQCISGSTILIGLVLESIGRLNDTSSILLFAISDRLSSDSGIPDRGAFQRQRGFGEAGFRLEKARF